MNNSFLIENYEDPSEEKKPIDKSVWARQREGELVTLVEAIGKVSQSDEWKVLKTHIFDGIVETIERKIDTESMKPEIDTAELYRLQGQLAWARKYADFDKLKEVFKVELDGLKKQLKHE